MEGGTSRLPNIFNIARNLVKSQPCSKRNGHTIFRHFLVSNNRWLNGQSVPPSNEKCFGTPLIAAHLVGRIYDSIICILNVLIPLLGKFSVSGALNYFLKFRNVSVEYYKIIYKSCLHEFINKWFFILILFNYNIIEGPLVGGI